MIPFDSRGGSRAGIPAFAIWILRCTLQVGCVAIEDGTRQQALVAGRRAGDGRKKLGLARAPAIHPSFGHAVATARARSAAAGCSGNQADAGAAVASERQVRGSRAPIVVLLMHRESPVSREAGGGVDCKRQDIFPRKNSCANLTRMNASGAACTRGSRAVGRTRRRGRGRSRHLFAAGSRIAARSSEKARGRVRGYWSSDRARD
jgi:hypothetical protein